MGLLNQVIAIEKDIKSRFHSKISDFYKVIQKPALFNGFVKEYQKLHEEDSDLPPESQKVTFRVGDLLGDIARAHTEFMDVTSRKDWTNCEATASIDVETSDGVQTLLSDVPISFLLFLEKQVTDLRSFYEKLPELAVEEDWQIDANSGYFRSRELMTHRNKRKTSWTVVVPATPEHPAQVKETIEDVLAGHWKSVKLSGAMPHPEKQALCERTEKLLLAVKKAREAANTKMEKDVPPVGPKIFNYLYAARIGDVPALVPPSTAPVE